MPRLASNSGVGIKKAVAFTVGSTCTFYAGATIYTYEYHVTLQQKLQERTRLQWSQIQPKAISIRRQVSFAICNVGFYCARLLFYRDHL